jgi:hypothetical protein
MMKDLSENGLNRRGSVPLKITIAVAVLGVLGMLMAIMGHGASRTYSQLCS